MKFFRMSAVSAVFAIFSGNAIAWNVGEIYYSMDASTVNQISPGYNPVLIHDGSAVLPSNGKSFFAAVNIANYSAGSNFVQFSPNVWFRIWREFAFVRKQCFSARQRKSWHVFEYLRVTAAKA